MNDSDEFDRRVLMLTQIRGCSYDSAYRSVLAGATVTLPAPAKPIAWEPEESSFFDVDVKLERAVVARCVVVPALAAELVGIEFADWTLRPIVAALLADKLDDVIMEAAVLLDEDWLGGAAFPAAVRHLERLTARRREIEANGEAVLAAWREADGAARAWTARAGKLIPFRSKTEAA